jgi:hypothetical protein
MPVAPPPRRKTEEREAEAEALIRAQGRGARFVRTREGHIVRFEVEPRNADALPFEVAFTDLLFNFTAGPMAIEEAPINEWPLAIAMMEAIFAGRARQLDLVDRRSGRLVASRLALFEAGGRALMRSTRIAPLPFLTPRRRRAGRVTRFAPYRSARDEAEMSS